MPDDAEPAQRKDDRLERERLASLRNMARGMAHDFSNFLMVILGQAELGQLTSPADSPAQTHFNQILTATGRAAELCRQLMAYAGHAQLSLATIDVAALLTEIVAEMRPALSPTCELRCLGVAEKLPPVQADRSQLRMAPLNAIRNACEALPPGGGVVCLSAGTMDADRTNLEKFRPTTQAPPGTYAYVEVADNGCGMDEETLARIFDPFFSTKKAHAGMGLSSLSGIVRIHRGAVHMESAIGQGTRLRILLPVSNDSPELTARLRHFLDD